MRRPQPPLRTMQWRGTVIRLVRGAVRLATFLILIGSMPSMAADAPTQAFTISAGQDVSVDTRDGLITATFSDETDDAALRAAAPTLRAQGTQSIILRGSPVRDIGALAGMASLQVLDLDGTQVRDLKPLTTLPGLRSLDLRFLQIGDLTPLAKLTELRTLNLGGTQADDLTPLAGLTDLRTLVLAVTRVTDLTPLTSLRMLTSLDLGSTRVSDLRPLARMADLRSLNLNGASVSDIGPLAHLVQLRTLDLGGTRVADVAPLAGDRDLRSLNLEGTLVADVTPLAGLTTLHAVATGGSLVRDMTPLTHLEVTPEQQPNRPQADPVLVWNDLANRAIQATDADGFVASRALAIESIAVLDTIKSIDGTPAFLVRLRPPQNIRVNVAVAVAAHRVLSRLFPTQSATLDAALATALVHEPALSELARAIAFGNAMADAVIMLRDEDGSMAASDAIPTAIAPGQWRPTPPGFLPPLHPQWATMQPFALSRPDQFRPAGPPALDSETFRQARDMVAAIGGRQSTTRTAEQTEIARYWSDAIGTYAPAGHWNAIAADIVAPMRLGVAVEAELFAELNVAMADAGIAMADAKYTYWFWRPVTAIHAGDRVTPPDPDWKPLLTTPNHPSYVSGHSTFSGAAAVVMTDWFGSRPFTFSSASLPGVVRHFTSFQQAAEEAAASRVNGGIHYPFDNIDGLAIGRSVGAWTMAVFQRIDTDRGPVVLVMDRSMRMANTEPQAVVGCAVDNLSPVAAVTVRLDGGAPFSVPVNDQGVFTLPPGHHAAVVTAVSATGRGTTIRAMID